MDKIISEQTTLAGDLAPEVALGERSLADAMAAIGADPSLLESKRRHWKTSMKRIAEGIGRPPQSLPARLTALRHHIGRLNPVLMRIEPKSLANHKSNLTAAINHFMKISAAPRRGVDRGRYRGANARRPGWRLAWPSRGANSLCP